MDNVLTAIWSLLLLPNAIAVVFNGEFLGNELEHLEVFLLLHLPYWYILGILVYYGSLAILKLRVIRPKG